jgi:hypothetical protein
MDQSLISLMAAEDMGEPASKTIQRFWLRKGNRQFWTLTHSSQLKQLTRKFLNLSFGSRLRRNAIPIGLITVVNLLAAHERLVDWSPRCDGVNADDASGDRERLSG